VVIMLHPAVLHDPQGTTRRVTVAWDSAVSGSLHIEDTTGTPHDIPVAQLSLTRGGWNSDAILLAWEDNGRTWAVTITEPQAVMQLAKELPAHFADQIVNWQKQSKRGERWASLILTVVGLVTLLPLLLLIALFLMRDRILTAVIAKIPTSIDAKIGDLMHAQL